MKILITGISGMVGTHWALRAHDKGWEIYGIDKISSPQLSSLAENIYDTDILNKDSIKEVLTSVKPDLIIHLAAQSHTSVSWKMEDATHHINYIGTLNILQSVREAVPAAKILLAGSSVVYGIIKPDDCPILERGPLKPVTPYAVTKAAMELLAYQYCQCYHMNIYIPRFFNFLGPVNIPVTAPHHFAMQLARIAHGKQVPIVKTGPLTATRDYLDISDGINAMEFVLDKGKPGVPVNICSGAGVKISEVLDILIEISGQKVEIVSSVDPNRISDEPVLYGDNSLLGSLGWKQKISLRMTLEKVYQSWMENVKSQE